jgi:hypothetical protein
LALSCQGTQAYEEVLSQKTVSSEDDKKERKGSEKEAEILQKTMVSFTDR